MLSDVDVPSRKDITQFRQDLFNIARTTLSSKVLSQDKDYFANLAVDAVLRLRVRHELTPQTYTNVLVVRALRTWNIFRSSKRLVESSPTPTSMKVRSNLLRR